MSVVTSGAVEKTYQTAEAPIRKVTVFDKEAEVQRTLNFKPETVGFSLLKVEGLPDTINASSLRADVSSNNARLIEVYHTCPYVQGKADEKTIERLAELEVLLRRHQLRKARVEFKLRTIQSHQNKAMSALNSNEIEDSQAALEPKVFERLTSALDIYENMKREVEEELKAVELEGKELNAEKQTLTWDKQRQESGKYVHTAHVLIEVPEVVVKKQRLVELDVFYIVSGAAWHAKYDIAVEKESESAILTYYGEVKNNTKENWVEVDLALSTAKPSVGGALPPLPRKLVDIFVPVPIYQQQQNMNSNLFQQVERRQRRALSIAAPPMLMSQMAPGGFFGGAPAAPPPPFQFAEEPETTVASGGDTGSTLFELQRLANIDSDNKFHRQTITRVTLDAKFTHAASPKVSKFVFLKCSTSNTSTFPFLRGSLAVFIDGSFVSESSMQLVRPGEQFALFLGIDDSIKLGYGPENIKKTTVSGGMMNRNKKVVETSSRDISVTNNGVFEVKCCIYEQLPFSKDGKVKVDCKKPDLKQKNVLVNSFNNIEYRTVIKPGEKFEMTFEYSIEWPDGEQLERTYKSK